MLALVHLQRKATETFEENTYFKKSHFKKIEF